MIWSVIPEEVIFQTEDHAVGPQVVDYLGRRVVVRQGRVDHLLSTDPADFLDQRFMPGALVNSSR